MGDTRNYHRRRRSWRKAYRVLYRVDTGLDFDSWNYRRGLICETYPMRSEAE